MTLRRVGLCPAQLFLVALSAALCTLPTPRGTALAATGDITTVAGSLGSGSATNIAQLPIAVAADGSAFYVSDGFEHVVRRVELVSGAVTVVAGTGAQGFSGDCGLATLAQITDPGGIAVDAAGNVFISDLGNSRIRRVDAATAIITTFAGNGVRGFGGDGGPATGASFNVPFGLALDASAALYVADQYNHRIRKISGGTVTTVAGNGVQGTAGDGLPATVAQLSYPTGVALDGEGNLVIADQQNHRIRKVDALTGVISTIAGTGLAGYSGDGGAAILAQLRFPAGVAVGRDGEIYLADQLNHVIRVVTPDGTISTYAGGGYPDLGDDGPATAARLNLPQGIALDPAGNLYIADLAHNRVRVVDAGLSGDGTRHIHTTAGNGWMAFSGDGGPAVLAQLGRASEVAVLPSGAFYIADGDNHRVRLVDEAGIIWTVAGDGIIGASGDGGPAALARLAAPTGVAVDAAGNLYIADFGNHRVRRVDAAGTITNYAGTGSAGYGGDGGPATAAMLYSPNALAFDPAGNLYILEFGGLCVRRVDAAGTITTYAGRCGVSGSSGDGGPATDATLLGPVAIALDAAGNLFIADRLAYRIRRVDGATGIITTFAGTGDVGFAGDGGPAGEAVLNQPSGVAVGGSGRLHISDTGNGRIRRVEGSPPHPITTMAGNGTFNFSGDGDPAQAASLAGPAGLAFDPADNLFLAEPGSRRIRRIEGAGPTAVGGGGGEPRLALHAVGPNPSAGRLAVWFSLAGDGPATLEILDLAGRRIAAEGIGHLGAGNHRLDLGQDGGLRGGIYFVRLTQGRASVAGKAAVMP